MKIKKLLAGILAGTMVIGSMNVYADESADDITSTAVAYYSFDNTLVNTVTSGTATQKLGAGDTWYTNSTTDASYSTDAVSGSAYYFAGNGGTAESVVGSTTTDWLWNSGNNSTDVYVSTYTTSTYLVECTADVDGYAAFTAEIYGLDSTAETETTLYIDACSDHNTWGDVTFTSSTAWVGSDVCKGNSYVVTVGRNCASNIYSITIYDIANAEVIASCVTDDCNIAEGYFHVIANVGTFDVTPITDGTESGEGLLLDVKGTEAFTVSMWVKTFGKASYQSMFFTTNENQYVNVATDLNGYATSTLVTSTSDGWIYMDNGSIDMTIGEWTYVTFTITADGVMCLYYDGELVSTKTYTGYSADFANCEFFLGVNWWNPSFCGLMDEVYIFDTALSATEISTLYASYNVTKEADEEGDDDDDDDDADTDDDEDDDDDDTTATATGGSSATGDSYGFVLFLAGAIICMGAVAVARKKFA